MIHVVIRAQHPAKRQRKLHNLGKLRPFRAGFFIYPIVGLSPYANDYKAFSLYLSAFQG